MATHYIENGSAANQYYFDAANNANPQAQRPAQDRAYASPITTTTTTAGPSEFSPISTNVSGARPQIQQIRSERNTYNEDDSYQLPQQHQSVAGFNKSVTQQQYPSSPSPVPQVRATVRSVHSQEQQHASSVQYQHQQQPQQRQHQQQGFVNYEQQGSQQPSQVSPQQHQYQYDPRQQQHHQQGQSTVGSAFYQTPGSAQYGHHDLEQRTESPSRGRDQHAQVCTHFFFMQGAAVMSSTFMC
jgi:hypothetical protein